MAGDFGSILFGDQQAKDNLQNQINSLSSQIASGIGNIPELQKQLANLKGQLAAYMKQQGATDASGRLIQAKDVSNDYLNQDYLQMRRQQAQDTEGLALAQAIKQGKQMQLKGIENYNPASIASQIENTQRNSQASLAGDIYNEQNQAYGKAVNQLAQNRSYATQLADDDRQNIMAQFSAQIQALGLSAQQQANLQNQLNNMPDGLLVDLAKVGVKAGVDYLTGNLFNPISSPAVPSATAVSGKVG